LIGGKELERRKVWGRKAAMILLMMQGDEPAENLGRRGMWVGEGGVRLVVYVAIHPKTKGRGWRKKSGR